MNADNDTSLTGERAALVPPLSGSGTQWIPWFCIVSYAASCAYWNPPILEQSWWLVLIALWAAPKNSLTRGSGEIPMIVKLSVVFVFAWLFYRMQGGFMLSTTNWRILGEQHYFDPFSRLFRNFLTGIVTAIGLAYPLYKLAPRIALPMATIAVLPYVHMIEESTALNTQQWVSRPLLTTVHLLTSLVAPILFFSAIMATRKFVERQHPPDAGESASPPRFKRDRQEFSPAVLFTSYMGALGIYGYLIECGKNAGRALWDAPYAGFLFLISLFAFGKLTVATRASLIEYQAQGRLKSFLGGLGLSIVILGTLAAICTTVFYAPLADNSMADAIASVGTPPWTVRTDGTALRIGGTIRSGLSKAVETAISENPQLTMVALDSVGGGSAEARSVGRIIKRHQLTTVVSELCASACTEIFAAGRERFLLPPGKLGFHACDPQVWYDNCDIKEEQDYFTSMGIRLWIIQKAEAVPNAGVWYPTTAELIAANIVTGSQLPTHPEVVATSKSPTRESK